jgi:hypothetical protein
LEQGSAVTRNQSIPNAAPQIALPWIVRLRYAMVFGQMGTILFVRYVLGIDLPLPALAIGPVLVGLSNLFLASRASRQAVTGIATLAGEKTRQSIETAHLIHGDTPGMVCGSARGSQEHGLWEYEARNAQVTRGWGSSWP